MMSMQFPAAQENGLIVMAVEDFEALLKPVFARVGGRAYVSEENPPCMAREASWFGQGIYLRKSWGTRYAVLELDDHFLIIPEGAIHRIWHQEKLGMKRLTTWRFPTMTFAGQNLIDGLKKLDGKYV